MHKEKYSTFMYMIIWTFEVIRSGGVTMQIS